MSRMSELSMEIAEMIEQGHLSFQDIARVLEIPVSWVNEVADSLNEFYNDSMDGDHVSALASVGWGTDEDYGYASDEF